MPLVAWALDLEWLAKHDACTTIMWSYDAGIDVDKRLPYLLLWNQCEKSDLWLYIVSPTYATLTHSTVLALNLNYGRILIPKYIRASGASSRQDLLSLYSLLKIFRSVLNTHAAFTEGGYLYIGERVFPGSNAPPRLLPQFLL